MRRRISVLVALGALLALPATASATHRDVFLATLSGAQEVPPVTTTATGQAWFALTADGTAIDYVVTYSGLSGSLAAAHIHLGAAGTNGGIMFPLAAGPSPMVGRLTADDFVATGYVATFAQAVDAMRAGNAYVNLHTAANPGGEIRGQLSLASGAEVASASLSGAQEVPPVTTGASGSATVVIVGDTIHYVVTYSGLSGSLAAAHIHLGARGANGGILFPLAAGPSPMVGTLSATDLVPTGGVTTFAQAVEAIVAGNTYVNLHTAANPGGEIRGQLELAPTAAPTPTPTAAPTAAPTEAPTPPPTSVAPPTDGGSSAWPAILAIAALAGALLVLGRPAVGRRS